MKDILGNVDRNTYLFQQKNFLQRFFGHLHTVNKHRRNVRRACFKMGLVRQGIFHDMSKYSPTEFWRSVKFYSGKFSPNAVDKRLNGSSKAWLHHKGRNKHHFEYWVDYSVRVEEYAYGCKMPMKYLGEMLADRYAACVAYYGDEYSQSDAYDYFMIEYDKVIMDEESKAVMKKVLEVMRDEGEEASFKYMKNLLKKTKGLDYTVDMLK